MIPCVVPTVSVRTFGCRLNQAESAALKARFAAAGFTCVDRTLGADVCVVHACAVTRTAQREALRTVRGLRRQAPPPLVVLAGCLAQAVALPAAARRDIDLLADQTAKWRLPEQLRDTLGAREPWRAWRQALRDACGARSPAAPVPRFPGTRAWLAVQDGCDLSCAYCIVPRARGTPRARPFAAVLDEARALIAAGHPELVLTGANLALYHDGGRDLADLAGAIAALPDLGRLRMGSIEPATVERRILERMAGEPRICAALHLPLQSGDAGILRAMGRVYAPETYARIVQEACTRVPGLALGTDLMAGFPGEDEAAFENTVRLVEALPFSNLHVFPYSERPGTAAATLDGRVDPRVRKARAQRLIRIGRRKRIQFARACLGQRVEILIERRDRTTGTVRGWTASYFDARIPAAHSLGPGCLVPARVTSVEADQLVCELESGTSPCAGPGSNT